MKVDIGESRHTNWDGIIDLAMELFTRKESDRASETWKHS